MASQSWIVMTTEERDEALLLNPDGVAKISPRVIDNPLADNLGHGVLLGKWVAPARVLNDPEYERWLPSLGVLPIRLLDDEIIFLPPQG